MVDFDRVEVHSLLSPVVLAPPSLPTIALSTKWYSRPERFHWAAEHGFALQYSPDPQALDLLSVHLAPFLWAGIPVRHHAFFPGYEIGHPDAEAAEQALRLHQAALEAMAGLGEPVLTVHVGLDRDTPIDQGRVVENLGRLVEYGHRLGITIGLENLRGGPAGDPANIAAWAEAAGSMITMDIGHAVSCGRVQRGEISVLDVLDMFAGRLVEVHMYERETDRHYPPRDMRILGPVVDRLLETACTWWTIELDDVAEALETRALLLSYLERR